MSFRLVPNRWP